MATMSYKDGCSQRSFWASPLLVYSQVLKHLTNAEINIIEQQLRGPKQQVATEAALCISGAPSAHSEGFQPQDITHANRG
jgi:hypothetical protein